MTSPIRKALPAALSVALVAGAFALPAVATTDDATSDEPTATEEPDGDLAGPGRHRHPFAHAALHELEEGELAERLAAELGLDADVVEEAIEAVRLDLAEERLADAVEQGRLTQEQADEILAAIADGTLDEVLPEIRLEHLEARLTERVAAGELTQEEADAILAAAEAGDWPRERGRRGHHGRGAGPGGPFGGLDGPLDDAPADDAGSTEDTSL